MGLLRDGKNLIYSFKIFLLFIENGICNCKRIEKGATIISQQKLFYITIKINKIKQILQFQYESIASRLTRFSGGRIVD